MASHKTIVHNKLSLVVTRRNIQSGMEDQQFDFGQLEVSARTLLCPTKGGRPENQDNYLLIDCQGQVCFLSEQRQTRQHLSAWPSGHMRLAVLDGMGGHSHGREAAELTVQGLLQIPASANLGALSDQLERLHTRLRHQMHRQGAEPGCTLTLLEIPPTGPALIFHVGDSRLYAINQDRAQFLTVDHIPITRFAMMRLVDKDEWFRQAHRLPGYQISQAFILGNSLTYSDVVGSLDPDLFELHDGNLPPFLQGLGDRRSMMLQSDQTYLLASDGLWHLQDPLSFVERWPELLTDPVKSLSEQLENLFSELIRSTEAEPQTRGDNCTAIAFRLRSQ